MHMQHSPGAFWVYNFLLFNLTPPPVWVEKIQQFCCGTICHMCYICVAIYKSGR